MSQYVQIEGMVKDRTELNDEAKNIGNIIGECTAYCNTTGPVPTDPLIVIVDTHTK